MVQFPVLKPPSQEDPANNHIIINFTRRYEGLKASLRFSDISYPNFAH